MRRTQWGKARRSGNQPQRKERQQGEGGAEGNRVCSDAMELSWEGGKRAALLCDVLGRRATLYPAECFSLFVQTILSSSLLRPPSPTPPPPEPGRILPLRHPTVCVLSRSTVRRILGSHSLSESTFGEIRPKFFRGQTPSTGERDRSTLPGSVCSPSSPQLVNTKVE